MKTWIRRIINIVIFLGVLIVWIGMFRGEAGVLSSKGIENLKYFTVLSNIFAGTASLLWLIWGKKTDVIKYVAAAEVTVTFVIVTFFLAPAYREVNMYEGANFWFHLVIPLFVLLEFLIFNETKIKMKHNILVIVPVFLYGMGYFLNIQINGIGNFPETNDWYAFMSWGLPTGLLIFAAIMTISFLLGLMIRGILKLRDRFWGRK